MTTYPRRSFLRFSATSAVSALAGCTSATPSKVPRKPNIIFILADDLGYGDLGCFGQQKIETPNIDRIRREGVRFVSFYSGSPVCAPSRCVLMTGKHTGHAFIRGNDEWAERGKVWDFQSMFDNPGLEGQRPLPSGTRTIGTLLQSGGYKTACVGKWGLGAPGSEGVPNKQGFDLFFGYNCQRQAHTYYPTHLYKNEQRVILRNTLVAPGTKLETGADPRDPASYAKYTQSDYAPDLMLNEIRAFVDDNRARPFFLFWSTPIPHVALQAPQQWVDHYVKKFGDETPYDGTSGYFPHRYPRACYAAMVSYLDEQVGLLVKHLKTLGIYENTLLVFTSDNGPTFNGGTDSPWFNSGGAFRSEQGWGKCSLHEGGIRVPMVASWPGQIKAGSESNHICAFWDILPTVCEAAGIPVPEDIDGLSFLPALRGKGPQRGHDHLFWEYPEMGGQQAVRKGRWKAIRTGIRKGTMKTALYDLDADLREENDVAAQHPDVVARLEKLMHDEHVTPILNAFKMKALGD